MSFAVVKGKLCSCSCKFLHVSVRVDKRAEKREMLRERRKKDDKKFRCAVVFLQNSEIQGNE